jgi:cytochrome c553
MRKSMTIVLAATLVVGLAGCGKKEQNQEAPVEKAETSPPKIKVTQGAVKKEAKAEPSKENSGQFYYSYNKEKKKGEEGDYNSEESKVRTTLDAYLNIRSPYERVQVELMLNKLSRDFIIKCSPCHDDYANGIIGPSLLDKDGEFIYDRIMAFKSGKKENVLMQQLVAQIDDAELKRIADEIAEFNKQIQEMRKGRQ